MDPSELVSSRFRWLLVWMSDMLLKEEVEKAVLLLRYRLGPNYDQINGDALKLLEALERENQIHEGDTEVLRMCLTTLERADILESLDEYEKERQAVTRKLNIRCSSVDGPFFGHRDIMDQIVGILDTSYDHVHMACIAGMPGTGKTRLANEVCLRLRQFHKVIFVDLRELKNIEAIFFAIMHGLQVENRTYEPDVLYGKLRSFDPPEHGGAVLFLDSVDDPLDPGSGAYPNPTYEAFVAMLENITNLPNKRLKLLITSRFGVEKIPVKAGSMDFWRLDGENELDMESAVEMVRYHAGKTRLEDNEAEAFVRLCSKIPLALKVVASRLQDQTVKPKDLLKYISPASGDKEQGLNITKALSHFGLSQGDQIGPCLKNTIQNLPAVKRCNLIKLAVIPGTFTLKVARVILGYKRKQQVELQLELQALKYRSLLDSKQETDSRWSQPKEDSTRYSLHLLLRSFVQQFVQESNGEMEAFFKEAELLFVNFYGKRMKKLAKMLQSKAVVALGNLQEDSANYIKALNIMKTSKEFHVPDAIYWMYLIVEMLFFTKERLKFYQERAESAKEHGQMLVYAESKCHEVYQLMELGHSVEVLLPLIQGAEDELKKLDTETIGVQLGLATCYHFRGDIYLRNRNWKEAIPQLEACLAIRKAHLKGDDLLTARAYNSLGGAYQDKAMIDAGLAPAFIKSEKERGKACYRKALAICHKKTGPHGQHLEVPTFLMNLGTCLHDMEDYEGAVNYYKQAMEQERLLGMEGADKMFTTLKNIAMSYYEMGKYDDAIPIAKQAMEGRKRLLEVHPLTARSIYFVGSLNLVNRNYKEARKYLDEALNMEEELWRKGMAHSIDWTRLKNKLEFLFTTLGKSTTLSAYKRRFREADKKSNQNKPKLEVQDASETESSNSTSSGSDFLKRKRGSCSSIDSSVEEEVKLHHHSNEEEVKLHRHSNEEEVKLHRHSVEEEVKLHRHSVEEEVKLHRHSVEEEVKLHRQADFSDSLPHQDIPVHADNRHKDKKRRSDIEDMEHEETDSSNTSISGFSMKLRLDDNITVHFPRAAPVDDEPVSYKWPSCAIS